MANTNLGKVCITPKGAYDASASYERLDVITYDGNGYMVLADVSGITPSDDGIHYMLLARKGMAGLLPLVNVPYAASTTVAANTKTVIGETAGALSVTLEDAAFGYDNEWVFVVTQGENAYDIVLPVVSWMLGIAPTFAANTTTEVRLFYVGDTLCGVWNA